MEVKVDPRKVMLVCGDPSQFSRMKANNDKDFRRWLNCAGHYVLEREEELEFEKLPPERQQQEVELKDYIKTQDNDYGSSITDLRKNLSAVKARLPTFKEAGKIAYEDTIGSIVFDERILSFNEAKELGLLRETPMERLKGEAKLNLDRMITIDTEN